MLDNVGYKGQQIQISQITRELESAYLFTHHPESSFRGWDYEYLFICPESKYKSNEMNYSGFISSIQDSNSNPVLDDYENLNVNPKGTKEKLFKDFISSNIFFNFFVL